jgi:transposase
MQQASQPSQCPNEPEFVAWLAIDWADQKHCWQYSERGSERIVSGVLENTPEAVEAWVAWLSQQVGPGPIAVALEQRRGALVALLSKYAQLHIFPVHPKTLNDYRAAWRPSGSKSDPGDTHFLWEILTTHRAHLRRLDPDTASLRLLQGWVHDRRKLVDERTELSNRLRDRAKIYFPQMVKWFEDLTTALVGAMLTQYPTLVELQKAKPAKVEAFLRSHGLRDPEKRQRLIEEIRTAVPATTDEAIVGAALPLVAAWVGQLKVLRQSIAALEDDIEKLAQQQDDWAIFDSLPGAGEVLVPRLMAALGTQRDRYRSAEELLSFSGIAPVTESSGKQSWVHFRWACPKFLRQTFHEWATCTLSRCTWAQAVYQSQLAKGKSHHSAVRAVAFKWIRILFRCWQDRKPYQEEVYLASLARRRFPLPAALKNL